MTSRVIKIDLPARQQITLYSNFSFDQSRREVASFTAIEQDRLIEQALSQFHDLITQEFEACRAEAAR
jgi:hypothetical protein